MAAALDAAVRNATQLMQDDQSVDRIAGWIRTMETWNVEAHRKATAQMEEAKRMLSALAGVTNALQNDPYASLDARALGPAWEDALKRRDGMTLLVKEGTAAKRGIDALVARRLGAPHALTAQDMQDAQTELRTARVAWDEIKRIAPKIVSVCALIRKRFYEYADDVHLLPVDGTAHRVVAIVHRIAIQNDMDLRAGGKQMRDAERSVAVLGNLRIPDRADVMNPLWREQTLAIGSLALASRAVKETDAAKKGIDAFVLTLPAPPINFTRKELDAIRGYLKSARAARDLMNLAMKGVDHFLALVQSNLDAGHGGRVPRAAADNNDDERIQM